MVSPQTTGRTSRFGYFHGFSSEVRMMILLLASIGLKNSFGLLNILIAATIGMFIGAIIVSLKYKNIKLQKISGFGRFISNMKDSVAYFGFKQVFSKNKIKKLCL